MKTILKRLKRLWEISAHFDSDLKTIFAKIDCAEKRIIDAEKVIRDRTTISVDHHISQDSTIILCGQYDNHDYVEILSMDSKEFAPFVLRLREMKHLGMLRRVDSGPSLKIVWESEKDYK